jgi:hypothetical protein
VTKHLVKRLSRRFEIQRAFSLGLFCLLILASGLHAQLLYTLQTKDLNLLYYDKAHEYIIPHLARCFENAFRFHSNLFHYTPSEPVTVMLQDFGDYGNAGATAVPNNFISVSLAPFSYVYETTPANERMNWLMNHEIVHVVAADKASSTDRFWRHLFFGKVIASKEDPISMIYSYLTTPRDFCPRWYHEGIAVFMETWMSGGLGRALGAYDEMVFRTMVRDSSYIYDVVGLESEGKAIDFQVGVNSYLYGTRFMSYLAYKYGPEKLLAWVSRTEDSDAYFSSQFNHVFGISLDDEWSNWIAWEHQCQRANLDSIRLYPVTPYRTLAVRALGSVSRSFYDPARRVLYSAINYPGQIAHIAAIDIDKGSITKLQEIRGPALFYVSSLAYDPAARIVFYTSDNNQWRDINALDLKTGESRMLLEDVRTGDLAFNQVDKSLWGIRHFDGISTIVRTPYPYTEWHQVYSWEYGKDMFDIDVSPDGSTLTGALAEVSGRQLLIRMDTQKLLQGNHDYEVLYDFENSTPANFTFSPDGKYLFGNTYRTGVSNVVRYDFENEKMEWLTNCETGFFRPIPVSNDSIIVFDYTGKGFIPVMIADKAIEDVSPINYLGNEIVEKYPVVKTWKLGSPLRINLDSLTVFSGDYDGFGHIQLSSAYPVVQGFKDYAAFGMRFNFFDPTLLYGLDLSASYTPNVNLPANQRVHAAFHFNHLPWKISGTYNAADFYDLFGPTKTSRKGYSLGIEYRRFLIFDKPKTMSFTISMTGYKGLERLPDFQNVATSFDKFLTLRGSLDYEYLVKSLGAVEDEKGVRWQFLSYNNYINSRLFSSALTGLDYGVLLPINHSSIWLRTSLGYSFGEREEPLANFYFGGFGNNWVDHQEARRYREFYSFPGVELNEIGGTNFGKLLVEWTLPPVRFRRFGFSTLYCNWTQLVLFSSGILTNVDDEHVRRSLGDVGAQLDFRLVIFSTLESTLSLGYAAAVEKDQRVTREFMFSLKVLH